MSIVSSLPEQQLQDEEAAIAAHLGRQPTFLATARDLFRAALQRRFASVTQAFDLDALHVTDYRLEWNQDRTAHIATPVTSRSLADELTRYLASRELPVYEGQVGIFDQAASIGHLGTRLAGSDSMASELAALLQDVGVRAYPNYPLQLAAFYEAPAQVLGLAQGADNRDGRDLPLKVWLAERMARQRRAEANLRTSDGTLTVEGAAMIRWVAGGLLDAGVTEEPGVFELTLRVPTVEARVSGCLVLTRSPRDLPAQSPAGVILLMAGQGLIEFSSGGEFNQYLARWLSDLQSHPWLWATIALNHRQAVLAHSPRALVDYPGVASSEAFTRCLASLLSWQQDSCQHLIRAGRVEPLYLEQAINLRARLRVGQMLQVRQATLQAQRSAGPRRTAAINKGLVQAFPDLQSLVSPFDMDRLELRGYRDDSAVTDLSSSTRHSGQWQRVSSRPLGAVLRELLVDPRAFNLAADIERLCIGAADSDDCIEITLQAFRDNALAVVRPLRYVAVECQLPVTPTALPEPPVNPFKQQAQATLADFRAMAAMLQAAPVASSFRLRPSPHSALQGAISEVVRQFGLLAHELRGQAASVLYQRLPLAATLPARLRRQLETCLHSDRQAVLFDYGESVTLAEMLDFYCIIAAEPLTAPARRQALNDLEEQYAVRALGMENATPLLDSLLGADQERALLGAVNACIATLQPLPGVNPLPPLEVLGHYLPGFDPGGLAHTRPTVALQQLLTSGQGQWLGQQLLKASGWHGAADGEAAPATLNAQLAWKALVLRYSQAGTTAGYDLNANRLWGKSYAWIRSDFEHYLLTSRQATSPAFAALLARLLRPSMPADFSVRDIPVELIYGSASWVNFRHGAELAHVIEPGSPQRMTFQQVITLPGQQAAGLAGQQSVAREKSAAMLSLRLPPLMTWAALHGVVPEMPLSAYTSEQIQQAAKALDAFEQTVLKAANDLFEVPPARLQMARAELLKHGISPEQRVYTAQRGSVPLFELYAVGKHMEVDFEPHTATTLPSTETLRARAALLARLGRLQVNIEREFSRRYDAHEAALVSAQQTVVRFLLDSLAPQQRQDIEYSAVRVLRVRTESRGSVAEETTSLMDSLMLRQGFILQVCKPGDCDIYEVFTRALHIQQSPGLKPLLIGGVIGPRQTGLHSWIHRYRHGAILQLDENAYRTGQKPRPHALSSSRLIVEELGSLPAAGQPGSTLPNTFCSARSKQIAMLAPLYIDRDQARAAARGVTAFDQAHPAVQLLKSITPFWGTFDDLLSGDQQRMAEGRLGLVFDLLFFLPVARFVGGAVRILKTAGKLGFKPALPRLGRLTRTLLVALAQEFNPADGLSQLLKWGRIKVLMGGRSLASRGLEHFKQAARRSSVARYDTRRGLVTVDDPALWKSPPPSDQLRRVNGIDNVPVRNTGSADAPRYHLLDPVSGLPYGPQLASRVRVVRFNQQRYVVPASPDLPDGYYRLRISNPDNPSQLLSSGLIAKPDAGAGGLWRRRGIRGGGKESFETGTLHTWALPGHGGQATLADMNAYTRSDISLPGLVPGSAPGVYTHNSRSWITAGEPPQVYEVVQIRNRFWQLHADGEQPGPFVTFRPVQGLASGVWEIDPGIRLQPRPRSKWQGGAEVMFVPDPEGPQFYRNLNNLPAATPWQVERAIDFKRIEQQIHTQWHVKLEGIRVISTTGNDLAGKMGIPYDSSSAKANPVAWTSPQGRIYIATDHPDFVVNGLVDTDKVRSTVVHEYVHAASHRHIGLQAVSGAEVNYDECLVDYFAQKLYTQIYPDRPYKSSYFSQDGTLWHGQLAPFMTQNASMSLEDIQQALFHNPGLFRPLSADALQAWKRLTDF